MTDRAYLLPRMIEVAETALKSGKGVVVILNAKPDQLKIVEIGLSGPMIKFVTAEKAFYFDPDVFQGMIIDKS